MLAAHHVGIGLVATKGNFVNSYFEVGFGRTDLFKEHRARRFKVDGFVSVAFPDKLGKYGKTFRPFAQMTVDSDFGKGADSIQSYFGIEFDLKCLFHPASCASN